MSDSNDTTHKDDKIFEALLKIAADEAVRDEMESLPALEELNKMHPPSNALREKTRITIKNEEKTYKRKKLLRNFKKIAAMIGFVFAICTAVIFSVEAYRNFIINIFINVQDDHVAFDFGQDEPSTSTYESVHHYMLDGFELINRQSMDTFEISIYRNADGQQIIVTRHIATYIAIAIDNEARYFTIVYLEGQRVHFFEADDIDDPSVVMWQDRNDVISIHANIDIDDLLVLIKNAILR